MTTEAPNTDLTCNLCGEKMGSVCMLSPNWSAISQFESQMKSQREHFKLEHGYEEPTP